MSNRKNNISNVIFLLDASGSMGGLEDTLISSFNSLLEDHKRESRRINEITRVTLITFGGTQDVVYFNVPIENVQNLSRSTYRANQGSTNIYDAIGKSIEMIDSLQSIYDDAASTLLILLTDGEHNTNGKYLYQHISKLIRDKIGTDRWTFTGQTPRFSESSLTSIGFPVGNVTGWEVTEKGLVQTTQNTSRGINIYYNAKSAGKMSSDNFYATANLGNVTAKTVYNKLNDVSDKFKVIEVPREVAVKDFVESQTGRKYYIGSTYYQLTKTETLQPYKNILVMEKGKKAIWAGKEARKLAGIPDNQTVKLTPGNLGNFDVYVESRSVNRKLVRGSKVLVDLNLNQHLNPTWGNVKDFE